LGAALHFAAAGAVARGGRASAAPDNAEACNRCQVSTRNVW
jgi:hypothetical protein